MEEKKKIYEKPEIIQVIELQQVSALLASSKEKSGAGIQKVTRRSWDDEN